ncbi:MAG TPA: hypothetical protein VI750_03150 [Pyrinomonadaceae bacterium]|nr:hypothetical protein [Pyrinomonadaceae bacterium]
MNIFGKPEAFRTEGGGAADPSGNFTGKPEAFRTEGGGSRPCALILCVDPFPHLSTSFIEG